MWQISTTKCHNRLQYASLQSFNLTGPIQFSRKEDVTQDVTCLLDRPKAIHPFLTSFLEAIIQVEADATVQKAQHQKN